jgi:hypothetical protein
VIITFSTGGTITTQKTMIDIISVITWNLNIRYVGMEIGHKKKAS